MSGLGRAFCHMPDATVQAIAAASEVKGGYTNLGLEHSLPVDSKGRCPLKRVDIPTAGLKFGTCSARANPRHITLAEADASNWALENRLHRPGDDGCRCIHPVDSAAWCGAASKGRSASRQLNRRCQVRCAVVLAGGIEDFYPWVASKDNPADAPSRVFEAGVAMLIGKELRRRAEQPSSSCSTVMIKSPPTWNQRELGFLVLCSGPRRDGDLCQMVELCGQDHGVSLVSLAVDPMVDSQRDLTNLAFLENLISDVAAGRFVGAQGAPPCSTVSKARHRRLSKELH
eukprot:4757797-Karenia_brevis.AAC.1